MVSAPNNSASGRYLLATVVGLLAVSLIVLAFAVGYVVRGDSKTVVTSGSNSAAAGASDANFSNLNRIVNLLQEKYVDPDKIDQESLYQAAINGMLQTLSDSGVFYVDPNTVKTSVGPTGTFEGIGATVSSSNNQIVIVAPIEGTPAERAGIKAGDVILAVDGESTEGWTQEKAVIKIRGPRGSSVSIQVRHTDGTEETLDIERDEIKVQSVTTVPPGGILKDGAGTAIDDVGYIHIREFSQTTADEVRTALRTMTTKKGLILDLRNDPGGLLDTTVQVADEFLDSGTILSERDRGDKENPPITAKRGGLATTMPVVIILNRFSASGSEVLAAALHDNNRATIVGEKSFGKGTVNVKNDLPDGGQLYVSVAKWLTPSGTQIDGVGIRPDIEVKLSNDDIDARRDMQLFKAIDVLRGTNTTPATATAPAADATPGGDATSTAGG